MFRLLLIFIVFVCVLGIGWRERTRWEHVIHDQSKEVFFSARFDLIDPETAPPELKSSIMLGYHLMLETKKYAPEYAGDAISCTNCHFSAGNTLGGANGGISLVGVTKQYPKRLSEGKEFSLKDRINACFERSLNGKPLPQNSEEMDALVAYLDWISSNVGQLTYFPWLGLKQLRSHYVGDPKKGKEEYVLRCAACHGSDGQGEKRPEDLSYPPLWGEHSFNKKAGMNSIPTLSSFIYYNMPYQEPSLTIEEALDIASFLISKPRPE